MNIVLSRSISDETPGVQCASTTENALFLADYASILDAKNEYFIIGGAEIYRVFEDLFDKIYLTEVFGSDIRGDATFDYKFDRRKWAVESEIDFPSNDENNYPFRISILNRKDRKVRKVNLSKYMTDASKFIDFLSKADRKHQPSFPRPKEQLLDLFQDYADREAD